MDVSKSGEVREGIEASALVCFFFVSVLLNEEKKIRIRNRKIVFPCQAKSSDRERGRANNVHNIR